MTLYFYKKPILVSMMKSFGNVSRELNYFLRGENNSKGVAVFVKQSLKIDFGNVNIDLAGRYCFAEIMIIDKTLAIRSIYAPTKDEPPLFLNLFFSDCKFFSSWFYISWGPKCTDE